MTILARPFADRVFETTSSQGTGAKVLLGAQPGYRSVEEVAGDGGRMRLFITDDVDFEEGTYDVAVSGGVTTLTPVTIWDSTNGGAAVAWGPGTRNVFSAPPASFLAELMAPGFRAHAQATPDMTVRIEGGRIFDGAALTQVAAQNSAAMTAPVGNPRIDRIVLGRSTGVVSVITGTPAALPAAPAITGDVVPLAQVRIETTSTVITDKMITDERPSALVASGVPTGAVMSFAGANAPAGWLLLDGSAVSRTTYASLFALLSTTYGAGDGSTTFNLPDMRGRVAVGKDNMGGTAANRITAAVSGITGTTLGAGGGDQRLHAHNHGVTDPGHVHTETNTSFPAGANLMGGSGVTSQTNTVNTGTATTGISIQNNTQGGTAQNVQPSLILNYIIKI